MRRGRAYLRWGLDNPEHYRILMMSRPDQTPERLLDERLADTAGLVPAAEDLAAAINAGEVAATGDPMEMTKVLWMMIHGMVSLLISKPEFRSGRLTRSTSVCSTWPIGACRRGPELPCCWTRRPAWLAVTAGRSRRLFEIMGGWVVSTEEVEAKLLFDRHSQHQAWRAEQWWDRLPGARGCGPGCCSRYRRLLRPQLAAAALAALDSTVARLAGAYRVVHPRLFAAYHRHRLKADPASDGSAIRTLDLLAPDVAADWREGEVLLQLLLTDDNAVQTAAAAVAQLERILVAAEGQICWSRALGPRGVNDGKTGAR